MSTLPFLVLVTTAATVATSRVKLDHALIGLEPASAVGMKGLQDASKKGCKDIDGCRNEKKNRWKNQDRALVLQKEGLTLLAVFDGHDEGGEDVAEALSSRMKELFEAADSSANEDWFKEQIKDALIQVDIAQKPQHGGGSTAVIAVVLSDKVLIANVGDSRALLLTAGNASVPLTAAPLSIDQTPCFEGKVQAEDIRIKGLSQCSYYANRTRGHVFVPSCTEAWSRFIIRMWHKDDEGDWGDCGARFTRSVGDRSCGECAPPTPVFSEHKFTSTDEYLILASDGLTEYLKNDDIGRLVGLVDGQLTDVLHLLLQESRNKWMRNNGNKYVDDTTIILVKLG